MVARSVALGTIAFTALFVWDGANRNWDTPEYGITGNDTDFADDVHRETTLSHEMNVATSQDLDALPPLLADEYCMDLATSQELDALPLPIADVYYEGKLNSDGCVPSMSFTGFASVTDSAPFLVKADNVTAASAGVLIYGVVLAKVPFEAGFLYVGQPWFYSRVLNSGGVGTCGGSYSFDFNAKIRNSRNPGSLVGVQIFTQYGYSDAGDPFGSGLTNGLRFTIQP